MKKHLSLVMALTLVVSLVGCSGSTDTKPSESQATESTTVESTVETSTEVEVSEDAIDLQILATSDLHGKFCPWDYALNTESTSGSMVQLATAINEKRNDNTLVLDAGDTIQDNSADLFLDEEVHPMIAAMNYIGYDAWTTGNHEYNYGMDVLRSVVATQEAEVLAGNVWDENGDPVGKPYAIFEKAGLKIAVIGMVTPNITRWDAANLADCTVTDPVEESKKAIAEVKDEVDVIIGLMHMDIDNEYGVANSGVTDLANACPEFDLIIASHGHNAIESETINGVLVVENKNMANTMSEIHLFVQKTDAGSEVVNATAALITIADYEADAEMASTLSAYDERAKENAEVVIGSLVGDEITPETDEITGIYDLQLKDTPVVDLVNEVQLYYSGAKVSSTAFANANAKISAGDLKRCDVSLIYKYANTLYTVEMTGEQLKMYMEWSVSFFNQFQDGDLTISFNPDIRNYNYDYFSGVKYDVDISKLAGERIVNLRWMDDTPVDPEETFIVAMNNYRANSHVLAPGEIYEEGNVPTLVEMDIRGELGGIRELIADYIANVNKGTCKVTADNNWQLIGYEWDEELHQKAVEQINDGTITLINSEDGRTENIRSITEADLK